MMLIYHLTLKQKYSLMCRF